MERIYIRNLLPLYGRKIIVTGIISIFSFSLNAQINAHFFDSKFYTKPIHFGILMGYNSSDFRIHRSNAFLFNDTITTLNSYKSPGFSLGIISNYRISRHFDFRLLPSLTFSERGIRFDTFEDTSVLKSLEAINLDIPLLIKFKSDPYKDMRVYLIGGLRYGFDMASNVSSRNTEDMIKINRHDISLDYGIGLEIYFPMFIMAPEIRISQGLFNINVPNHKLIYSRMIDALFSRSILFTLHFEG